ncbi:MAG: Ku protein [Verrucomicrobiota bacterium]
MRAIWKGSISFSLVNIPIALYPATRQEQLSFRMLRDHDLSPIDYKRVAQADGKEVAWEHIVKGYEYDKGKFVVLKDEDFRRVDLEATQTIDIIDFVELAEIDPMFFDKPYYLEPDKGGAKAYALLREALKQTERVGIAKVVIKTRQHLAAVKASGSILVLELMHFPEELVKPGAFKVPARSELGKKQQEMATALIDSMTDHWDPAKYTDEYRSALLKLIHDKVEHGGKLPASSALKKPKATKVIDLVSVLQESLNRTRQLSKRKGHAKPKRVKKAA